MGGGLGGRGGTVDILTDEDEGPPSLDTAIQRLAETIQVFQFQKSFYHH